MEYNIVINLFVEFFDQEELVESEKSRRFNRLKGHYQNHTWKKRDLPPSNWNSSLPHWLEEKNKNTYLAVKANDIENGSINDIDMTIYNACSLL